MEKLLSVAQARTLRDREILRRYRQEKATIDAIAAALDINRSTVYRVVKKRNGMRPRGFSEAVRRHAVACYQRGMLVEDIRASVHKRFKRTVSASWVAKVAREAALPLRKPQRERRV